MLPSRPALLAALLVLAAPGSGTAGATAQTPGREPAVAEIAGSTRAMGMGGAYALGTPDSDVLFYNPALVERAEGSTLLGVHLLGGDALALGLSTAREWFGGGVGFGLRVLEYDAPGPGLRDGGLDPLVARGGDGVGELEASVGASGRLGGFRVGLAGKLVAQRWGDRRGATGAVDVGVARDVGPLTAGLAVRNLGPALEVAPGEEASQPRTVTLGVGGYGRELGPLDVGLAAALSVRDDDEVVASGGIEIGYWPVVGRTFVGRVGFTTVPEGDARPLALGASYQGEELVLSWAWTGIDGADGAHRISLGWR